MILTITIARKPVVGSVAQNVLKWDAGGLNINVCRIPTSKDDQAEMLKMSKGFEGRKIGRPELMNYGYEDSMAVKTVSIPAEGGRWPTNLILSRDDKVLTGFPDGSPPCGSENSAARFFKQIKEEE